MSGSREKQGAAYVRALYEPDEHFALLAVGRVPGFEAVRQRIVTAGAFVGEGYQGWLRHLNARGYDLFVSMNPIAPARGQREKSDVVAVRRLQLDLDRSGASSLARVLEDVGADRLPQPAAVIRSSHHNYQVLWHTAPGWSVEEAEDVMRRLAACYGGDSAVADVARVMRLPGFRNRKPGRGHALVSWTDYEGPPVAQDAFAHLPEAPTTGSAPATPRATPASGEISQSERDWAFVRGELRKGAAGEELVAVLTERRSGDKWKPADYARRTVRKAVESLQQSHPVADGGKETHG